jgi:hypothetical protein
MSGFSQRKLTGRGIPARQASMAATERIADSRIRNLPGRIQA